MKNVYSSVVLAVLVGGLGLSRPSLAQPLLAVRLGCEHTAYLFAPAPGSDPIGCVVTVENVSGRALLATRGFAAHLELGLRIGSPEGRQITAHHLLPHQGGPNLPAFIVGDELVVGDPVEVVPSDFELSVPFNVRDFYTLRTAGLHTAQAFVPVGLYETASVLPGTTGFARLEGKISGQTLRSNAVTFTVIADADRDGWCFPHQHLVLCPNPKSQADCEDRPAGADGVQGSADDGANLHPGKVEIPNNGLDDDCNPRTPDVQVVNPATLVVTASKHTVGPGQHPGVAQAPLANVLLRVFDRSAGSCVMQRFGVAWHQYEAIWTLCPNVTQGRAVTDTAGMATMRIAAGTYLVLSQYDPQPGVSGDEVYLGVSLGALGAGATKQELLQVIVRADGSVVPGKYQKKTGSELLIIEPEYIEWDSTQELYPFIFVSIGDWQVTTSIAPPGGFVADTPNLTAEVKTETEALQFTLTDVGTKWVDTDVTYDLTHKGKKEKVKSKIGVKLTKKLAKEKGLTIWGKPLTNAQK